MLGQFICQINQTNNINMLLKKYLKKNKITIIDLGCAGGIDPIFSTLIKEEYAKAFGFDGNKNEIKKLIKNTKSDDTTYINNLISDKNEMIDFFISGTVSSLDERKDRIKVYSEKYENKKVQSYTLDNWLSKNNISNNIILKLDIEGSEVRALNGAKLALKNMISFIKVEFNYHSDKNKNNFYEIHEILLKNNFQLMSITNEESPLFGVSAGDGLYFKNIHGYNLINSTEKKMKFIIQSVYTSILLKKYEYAALLLNEYSPIISKDISNELWKLILKNYYLPNVSLFSFPRLSFMFYFISAILAGKNSHKKSYPKINRLINSKFLFVNLVLNIFKKKYKQKLLKKILIYKIKKDLNE